MGPHLLRPFLNVLHRMCIHLNRLFFNLTDPHTLTHNFKSLLSRLPLLNVKKKKKKTTKIKTQIPTSIRICIADTKTEAKLVC